ncbi:MAG: lipid deacylase LpxR family protein [Flavipsychrobacter sp.]|jgi:hypothetical protein|nr:lipid deacylase LpxR family protein [Flavipsychrobacter sp.]
MYHTRLLLPVLLLALSVSGQAIDNTLSYKNINKDQYFRLSYENDYFSANDYYYTQGIALELVTPALNKSPLYKILIKPIYGYSRYSLSIEHNVYTPCSIRSHDIIYGERPFSACIFLKASRITIDTINKRRLSVSLTTGIIGPAAGAEELQAGVHRIMPHNTAPLGWSNQVQNDVILNYQVNFEKRLYSYGSFFELSGFCMARAGTLSDKITGGIVLQAGHFDSPYRHTKNRRKNFRLYAYEHQQVNVIAYDATLQGGLFNRKSPYTLGAAEIARGTFQNRYGIVLVYRGIYLEYFQSFITSEFRRGRDHRWGGIQIAVGL